jgi:hypothetical protein
LYAIGISGKGVKSNGSTVLFIFGQLKFKKKIAKAYYLDKGENISSRVANPSLKKEVR